MRLLNEVTILRGFPVEEHFVVGPDWNIDRVVPTGLKNKVSHPEYFHISNGSVLLDRSKRLEIFSDSSTPIVAQVDFRYESELGSGWGTPSFVMGVRAEKSGSQREKPKILEGLPSSASPLQMLSVIRLSKIAGVEVAAVASYSADGELFCVVVDALKDGGYSPHFGKTVDEDIQNSISEFGFPLTFSIDEFRRTPTALYERKDGTSPLTVINLHYARSRWVEQYVFRDSLGAPDIYASRILEFRLRRRTRRCDR